MTFTRRALAVAWKDLLVERRSKETLNALLFLHDLHGLQGPFALGLLRELRG